MFFGIATALELAFDLGRYEGGDRGAREAVIGRARRNAEKSADIRTQKAADWHDKAEILALQELEQNPRLYFKTRRRRRGRV